MKNEKGNKYGSLTVLKENGRTTSSQSLKWLCRCECGNTKTIIGQNLRNGSSKSCGCGMGRKGKFKNSAAYTHHYNILKTSCKKLKRELELNFKEWVKLVNKNCFYCGEKPNNKRYSYNRVKNIDTFALFNGVDRIDSSKGYLKNNVVSCCIKCNRMKSDFTKENFLNHIKKIYNHGEKIGFYKED